MEPILVLIMLRMMFLAALPCGDPGLSRQDNGLLGTSTPRRILFGDCAIQNDSFCIQPIFEVVAISAAALNIQFIGSCRDAGV